MKPLRRAEQGRALAGGGRYDHLIKKLSGNVDMPASGFAIGDMTLSDCLQSKGLLPTYILAPDLFLIGDARRKKEFPCPLLPDAEKRDFPWLTLLKMLPLGNNLKKREKAVLDMV